MVLTKQTQGVRGGSPARDSCLVPHPVAPKATRSCQTTGARSIRGQTGPRVTLRVRNPAGEDSAGPGPKAFSPILQALNTNWMLPPAAGERWEGRNTGLRRRGEDFPHGQWRETSRALAELSSGAMGPAEHSAIRRDSFPPGMTAGSSPRTNTGASLHPFEQQPANEARGWRSDSGEGIS